MSRHYRHHPQSGEIIPTPLWRRAVLGVLLALVVVTLGFAGAWAETAVHPGASRPQGQPGRGIDRVAATFVDPNSPGAASFDPKTGILKLEIPRGSKGDQGPVGPPGPKADP